MTLDYAALSLLVPLGLAAVPILVFRGIRGSVSRTAFYFSVASVASASIVAFTRPLVGLSFDAWALFALPALAFGGAFLALVAAQRRNLASSAPGQAWYRAALIFGAAVLAVSIALGFGRSTRRSDCVTKSMMPQRGQVDVQQGEYRVSGPLIRVDPARNGQARCELSVTSSAGASAYELATPGQMSGSVNCRNGDLVLCPRTRVLATSEEWLLNGHQDQGRFRAARLSGAGTQPIAASVTASLFAPSYELVALAVLGLGILVTAMARARRALGPELASSSYQSADREMQATRASAVPTAVAIALIFFTPLATFLVSTLRVL